MFIFLFGKDDDAERQFIYVGEADDTLKRLLQPHTFERDGSYWTEAVIFVTPDGTLEKGRVKYLENRFYTIAVESNRYIVKNGNTPPQSPMTKQNRDLLEEFIINVKLILPTLGHKTFEPLPSFDQDETNTEEDLLYFSRNSGKGGKAVGKITTDGFWVLKGSYIYPKIADYIGNGLRKIREKYAAVIDKNNILLEDISFGSPSYAAMFVCGKSSNGLIDWKNKDNVQLKALVTDEIPQSKAEKISRTTRKSQAVNDVELMYMTVKKITATGYVSGDGFIVRKGSGFSLAETKSCPSWIKKLRARLISEGKVKEDVFAEDVYFKSLSAAAGCVAGASENGNTMWMPYNVKVPKKSKKKSN